MDNNNNNNNDDDNNEINTNIHNNKNITTNNKDNHDNKEEDAEEEDAEEEGNSAETEEAETDAETDQTEFRNHMYRLAFEQAHSTKSAVMTREKFEAIIHFLKNPEGDGTNSGTGTGTGTGTGSVEQGAPETGSRPLDGHGRSWVRSRGFCLVSFPEENLQEVLVVPARERGQAGSRLLRVLHFDLLFEVVQHVHQHHFRHGGYKRVLNYLQDRYYGVTRGYVQEFCSMCPVCRPRKRRPVCPADVPIEVVNQILQQSLRYQHTLHSHAHKESLQNLHRKEVPQSLQNCGDRHQSLQRPGGSSTVQVIDVDDLSDSEDGVVLSSSRSSSSASVVPVMPAQNKMRRSRVGKQSSARFSDKSGEDQKVLHSRTVLEGLSLKNDGGGRQEEEECGQTSVSILETESSRNQSRRLQDHRETRTVVKGADVYIVTVNKDYNSEDDDDHDDADEGNALAVLPTKKMKKEPVYVEEYSTPTSNPQSQKRVGRNEKPHTPNTSKLTTSSQSKSTANNVKNHRTSKSMPVPKHSDHDTEFSNLPVDPASIKRERTEEDSAVAQTGVDTYSHCSSENNEEYAMAIEDHIQHAIPPKSGTGQVLQTRDKRVSSKGSSNKNLVIMSENSTTENIVIKTEPTHSEDFSHHNILTQNKDRKPPSAESPLQARSSEHEACPPPPAKKIKKEIHPEQDVPSCPHPSPSPFFQHLHVDIIDMSHCPHHAFHFICHVTDRASKLHVLFPLQEARMTEVASGLDRHVLSYYGMPGILHSSSGHQFVADLIEALAQVMEGAVLCANGESPEQGEGKGGGTNVVEELIAMLRVERCSNSGGAEKVPWVSWLPRIMRSLNRDWFAALRTANPVASSGRLAFV